MFLQHTGTGLFAYLSLENLCIFAVQLLLVSFHAVLMVCKFFLNLGVLPKRVSAAWILRFFIFSLVSYVNQTECSAVRRVCARYNIFMQTFISPQIHNGGHWNCLHVFTEIHTHPGHEKQVKSLCPNIGKQQTNLFVIVWLWLS